MKKIGNRFFDVEHDCSIMGILNVTPDSFSDGGRWNNLNDARRHTADMIAEGAAIVDVGGESTRPGFTPVGQDEEIARVVPVVRALAERGVLVSVDTRHPGVARAALDAGAHILNDVSGFEDPEMVRVAAEYGCGVVAMHACKGYLAGRARADAGKDPEGFAREVEAYLLHQAHVLEQAGVEPSSICIDPGPGFGTNADEDLAVQAVTSAMTRLGYPYLCAP